jgi:pimeloyl-ACP methyl ester carboxylesterase
MRLGTSLALLFALASSAAAQPVEEAFTTADGVKLKGLFHASGGGAGQNDAVVLLLYPPGVGQTMESTEVWASLAKSLNVAGFHVFRFDWRGHGKSTDIEDTEEFWNVKGANGNTGIWNIKYVKGVKDKPIKNKLTARNDIDPKYFPVYANDLAAVRMHLDAKNDKKVVNTSSLYIVGAGETATLGLLWATHEWQRGAIKGGGKGNPAGVDLAGSIWLSGSRSPHISTKIAENWKNIASKMRDRNPMLFLYGEMDAKGATEGKYFYETYLAAKGNKTLNPLEQTFLASIGGSNASGSALLGNEKTEEEILRYLKARQKDRASLDWKERKFATPYFVDLKQLGLFP